MIQVMVDLETMSQRSNASIASIGAVKFEDGKIIDKFYCTVDIKSCKELGLNIQKETVEWWSRQNPEALAELRKNNIDIKEALADFREWYGKKSLWTWSNGAGFDNVILENAYKAIGENTPWKFYDSRCYRTVKAIINIEENERQGTHHNALDDAIHQAKHLMRLLES
jgi:exodeoxyribonuclease VIII